MAQAQPSLTIATVGDISLAGGFCEDPSRFTRWIEPEVRAALQADITLGNLEFVFLPTGETWPGELCLAEPAIAVAALQHAGFTVLSLANNHSLDYQRERGLVRTLEVLDAAGIAWCGAGRNAAEAERPAVVDVRGTRVGLFSRAAGGSNVGPAPATATRAGLAVLESDALIEQAQAARVDEGCRVVVLSVHWGLQNLHDHPPALHDLALRLLDNGVDLILGHHAHVVQGLLRHRGKYVFFGQGNFFFHPYPYPHVPTGVLYGPEAVNNRIAAVSRFTWRDGAWDARVRLCRQKEDDRVGWLESPAAERRLGHVTGRWSRRRVWAFHLAWRRTEAASIWQGLLHAIRTRNGPAIRWYLNPLHWFGILWRVAVCPKYG